MMSKKSLLLLITTAIASLLVSCGSMKNTAVVHRTTNVGGSESHDTRHFEVPKSLPPQSRALLDEAKQWIGTPYRYGGEDKSGVDCSGLVLKVYKSALDIKLPRNSAEQSSYCTPLGKDKLMPGDLLFFATTGSKKKVSHVGIYVGDGKMIHSSASKGVIVSNISDNYYIRTFAGAGCIDKYRAMLDPVERKPATATPTEIRTTAPPKAQPPVAKASPTPAPTPTQTDENLPFKMTPVATLPSKTVDGTKTAPQNPEPTPDEARKAVLNSIIEQKLDSIFNR